MDTSLPASIRELVLTEVNIKDIKTIGADEGFLVKRVKPDFKKLGPKFGKLMKSVAAAIAALDQQGISRLEREGQIELDAVEGGAVPFGVEHNRGIVNFVFAFFRYRTRHKI